ncbi:MAG: formylglycine-generating enzyme family protein [Fimbriiglobus sp.]|jgi:formylglycine-generating enzyme required for sulfatase activity|nr:formylglycine-generating enzyme family protein [Fimbriiglobus sp.]
MKLPAAVAVLLIALAVVVAVGQDEKKPDAPAASVIAPLPPEPKVDYAFKQEKKSFTEKFTETIKVPQRKKKGKPQEYTNKEVEVTFDMVFVPGGTFEMGSPESETGRQANEGPVNKATVRDYWIAKYEVTWDVFDVWYRNAGLPKRDEAVGQFEADNPGKELVPDAITRPTNPYVDDTYGHDREGKPAICMSHHSAMVFCHWLRLKTGKPYRLPTEAEWEYAARAGEKDAYGIPKGAKLEDFAWFKDNSKTDDMPDGTTHKPGEKKANAFGLHDMHGNVAEWTLDLFDANLFAARAKDPLQAPAFTHPKNVKWGHIVKGGSWADKPEDCRAARRLVSEIDWMDKDPNRPRSIWWLTEKDTIGFRMVLPADEYPELKGLKPAVVKAGL